MGELPTNATTTDPKRPLKGLKRSSYLILACGIAAAIMYLLDLTRLSLLFTICGIMSCSIAILEVVKLFQSDLQQGDNKKSRETP